MDEKQRKIDQLRDRANTHNVKIKRANAELNTPKGGLDAKDIAEEVKRNKRIEQQNRERDLETTVQAAQSILGQIAKYGEYYVIHKEQPTRGRKSTQDLSKNRQYYTERWYFNTNQVKVFNEEIKSKTGNISIQDRFGADETGNGDPSMYMGYNDDRQMESYYQRLEDPLGNILYTWFHDAKYDGTEQDAKMTGYEQTDWNEIGVWTRRKRENMQYYPEGHVGEDQMSYYEEWMQTETAPLAPTQVTWYDAVYFQRPVTLERDG